jgi:hypothetical protein
LVTVGAPNFLSMTTFRPFGPSVTLTASASWSTPRLRAARASVLKCSSLDFGAAVLPVENLVADLELHRNAHVLLVAAGADGDDLALLRLFLGGVGNEETAAHLLSVLERPHNYAIGEGSDLGAGLCFCGHS